MHIQIILKTVKLLKTFENTTIALTNVDNQLDATVIVLLLIPISPTCFGQFFARPQEL